MSNNSQKYSSENEFIIRNKKFVINSLLVLTFLISLLFMDFYLLPKTKTKDILISYSTNRARKSRQGKDKEIVSYNYYTKKGHSFSTKNFLIEENEIEIEYSFLLKIVSEVKSKDEDYSKYLVNGLNPNGIHIYSCTVLLLSIAISLKILMLKKGCSENTFYNIICFNGFILFICLYMAYLF
ncbi:hypothetical protein [[Flexibacter] sp. ATCC 35103]|uniref:hypothetical protein n=1 Tax=[Flexibacter] sp. ATCC 35103 TaxID=1937528 RepID=UPI0009C96806|nr:hypothetical protein [[Flexibacter] sp. ATCC 35103]OMQ10988.1 hypothetical protein BXU01_11675 [[Flexibacter] sp. ATCC 35103]